MARLYWLLTEDNHCTKKKKKGEGCELKLEENRSYNELKDFQSIPLISQLFTYEDSQVKLARDKKNRMWIDIS